jgi:hypothetical protein
VSEGRAKLTATNGNGHRMTPLPFDPAGMHLHEALVRIFIIVLGCPDAGGEARKAAALLTLINQWVTGLAVGDDDDRCTMTRRGLVLYAHLFWGMTMKTL